MIGFPSQPFRIFEMPFKREREREREREMTGDVHRL